MVSIKEPARLASAVFVECIGDYLPLVEKVVASQFAKITCPDSRFFVHMDYFCIVRHPPQLRGRGISPHPMRFDG
jgi:hypothetical protein